MVDQVSGPKLSLQVLPEMLFAQENQASVFELMPHRHQFPQQQERNLHYLK